RNSRRLSGSPHFVDGGSHGQAEISKAGTAGRGSAQAIRKFKMKVLIVDLETEWRGGQNQALLTLRGLRSLGVDARLLAVHEGVLARRAASEGGHIYVVPAAIKRARAAMQIGRLVRRNEIDLVHANEPHALTAAWVARAHNKARVVASRRV